MRIKPQSQNVSDFASKLQGALDEKSKKKFAEDSPEAAAVRLLGEMLKEQLAPAAPAQPEKPPGKEIRSPLRAWIAYARLGDVATFYGYTPMAFQLAAKDVNKKVSVRAGSFLFGNSVLNAEIKNDGYMVTVVQDEAGRRLEGNEPASDEGQGGAEADAQKTAEDAPS